MDKKLIIDLLSDTHGQHDKMTLEGGDMLIHAGDVSGHGSAKEIMSFLTWFANQHYNHLLLVPGNHDFGFEETWKLYADECKRLNINLLHDSGVELEGIKIWGSAVQPWFHDWAFNRARGADIKKHWDLIPENTEILVTHGPPMGILDQVQYGNRIGYNPKKDKHSGDHVGCQDLDDKIWQTQIKLHVFGHIHEGRGYRYIQDKAFVNASALDGRYRMVTGKPIRVIKDIDDVYLVDAN